MEVGKGGEKCALDEVKDLYGFETAAIVDMNEVVEYIETVEEPASFGERIVEAFKESWKGFYDGVQNFVVWIVYALPTLLVMAVIVVAFVLLIIKLRKRTKEKYLSGQNTPDTKNSENPQNPYDNFTI